ncbi:STAS domain-containing protein [Solidesulfovibrio carbinolicus]|uniref:Anti-sigma factor antagonist n=1 Tax=Solidesulfovibrio carbinolicus TaxID=296842 RepID=A0A4P6HM67_9BACT|nr:STAS domain-containing protein [Solidesulfovibrio carbinolicus]QAZ68271.1 hypothetical protein C3Y92_13985 [Solidesulfovibrio carbinolicus]
MSGSKPLQETVRNDCLLIALQGKLDASTTPGLQQQLCDKLRCGQKFLALDFSAVSYLASSGLRMLLVLSQLAGSLEGRIVLCGMDQTMRDMLTISGFAPYFPQAQNTEEAFRLLET